jgi:hypothetical protein
MVKIEQLKLETKTEQIVKMEDNISCQNGNCF